MNCTILRHYFLMRDVASWFRLVLSSALLTVVNLINTCAGPNLDIKEFLLQTWKEYIKSIISTQWQTANCEVVIIEVIMTLFIRICNLHVRVWFGIFENLAVDELFGTWLIDRGICGIFPTERKIVPSHWTPLANNLTKMAINSINSDNMVFIVNIHWQNDASSHQFSLCRVVSQVTIYAHNTSRRNCKLPRCWAHVNGYHAPSLNPDGQWPHEVKWAFYLENSFMAILQIWWLMSSTCGSS